MDKEPFKDRVKNAFTKKKVKGFFDRYGFYIALFLCVCIVGATAVFANGSRAINEPDKQDVQATDPPKAEYKGIIGGPEGRLTSNEDDKGRQYEGATDLGLADPDKEASQDHKASDQAGDPIGEQVGDDSQATSASGEQKLDLAMIMPVDGDIQQAYTSEDELVFSQTLQQWSAHRGIDISGPIGSEVKAALDGTVETIVEDPLRGIEISLRHEGDITTIYTGVSTSDMVKVGQEVTQGQVISGIGQTAAFEVLDPSHLHFEVLHDGDHQDPMDYINK